MAGKIRWWWTVSDGRTNEGTATKTLRPRRRAVDAVGLKRDCSGSDSGRREMVPWKVNCPRIPGTPLLGIVSCGVVSCRGLCHCAPSYCLCHMQTAVRLSRLHRHGRASQWRRWRALQQKRVVRVVTPRDRLDDGAQRLLFSAVEIHPTSVEAEQLFRPHSTSAISFRPRRLQDPSITRSFAPHRPHLALRLYPPTAWRDPGRLPRAGSDLLSYRHPLFPTPGVASLNT